MTLLSDLTRKVYRLAQMLENPVLLSLRRCGFNGGMLGTFSKLNRPWLRALNIATVLDVGANVGQFAAMLHVILPEARIYSFEPLGDCFERLQFSMKNVPNFTPLNIALGDQAGSLAFERNAATVSSSFLKLTEVHKMAFPHTRDANIVTVEVERLDDLAERLVIVDPLLVKIDVQGYEDRVLRGGEQTIKRAQLIIAETSFERLYEGQALFDDIYRVLTGWGFAYTGSLDQLSDPSTGRTLQEDSVFTKRAPSA